MAALLSLDVRSVKILIERATVDNAVDRYERKILTRTGAFGRTVMRRSIRKARKKGHKPTPPFPRYKAHPNSGLRLIIFVYDSIKGSVTIGPLKFRTKTKSRWHNRTQTIDLKGKSVPELLNEGGTATITRTYKSGRTYRDTANYRRFPFRDLAFDKTVKFMKDLIKTEEIK